LILLGALHGQFSGSTVEVNYYVYPIVGVISFSAFLVLGFISRSYYPNWWVAALASLYLVGVFLLCLIRPNIGSEIPRAISMGVFIWSGLILGSCVGSSEDYIKTFMEIILIFGVILTLLSIFTGYAVVAAPTKLEISRAQRYHSGLFGVIDPPSIFAAALWLYLRNGRRFLLWILILDIVLIVVTVTRFYYITLFMMLFVSFLARFQRPVRFFVVFSGSALAILVMFLFFQVSNIDQFSWLSNLGFTTVDGRLNLDDPRWALTKLLLPEALNHPLTGIGMDAAKNLAWFSSPSSAKTEHGYIVHLAAFGLPVSSAFFLVMFIGGLMLPVWNLVYMKRRRLVWNAHLYGFAFALAISGFIGNFGSSATLVSLFALMFVGISIRSGLSLHQRTKYSPTVNLPVQEIQLVR